MTRSVRIDGDRAIVQLTKGLVAIIDAADASWAAQWNWSASISGSKIYAVRAVRRRRVYLHRDLLAVGPAMQADHISGDTLDCRRSNLRAATHAENAQNSRRGRRNTSGFKGVAATSAASGAVGWRAYIRLPGRTIHLGIFDNAETAARAHDEAARRHRGQFARLNFPRPGEQPALAA
ncbi:MAG: HNH endonuclease [Bauldia sp.]|nr:HNH endonuclease [Bauldia sp.]